MVARGCYSSSLGSMVELAGVFWKGPQALLEAVPLAHRPEDLP